MQPDRPRPWRRRILIVAAVVFGLLVIFHRPLLLHLTPGSSLGRQSHRPLGNRRSVAAQSDRLSHGGIGTYSEREIVLI